MPASFPARTFTLPKASRQSSAPNYMQPLPQQLALLLDLARPNSYGRRSRNIGNSRGSSSSSSSSSMNKSHELQDDLLNYSNLHQSTKPAAVFKCLHSSSLEQGRCTLPIFGPSHV